MHWFTSSAANTKGSGNSLLLLATRSDIKIAHQEQAIKNFFVSTGLPISYVDSEAFPDMCRTFVSKFVS
jgi:hypothetical protein